MICSYEVFDMMKHSKKALLSLTALAASAVVLFSGCADEAASSSTAPAASSETTAASSAAQTSTQSTELLSSLTTKELEELVSGDVTLVQLEKERLGVTETPSAASTTTSSAASSKRTSSSKTTTTTASVSYEDEIQDLLNQLYAVKAKAESGLNSAIQSAKNEYYALPDEQKSQAKKISIVMGKASELQNLQSTCDSEVNRIVEQMRKVLRANGQSTALADQALASYEAQKESTYASLKSKLLG